MVIPARPPSHQPGSRPSATPSNPLPGSPDIPPFLQQHAQKAQAAHPRPVSYQSPPQLRRSPPGYRHPSQANAPRNDQQSGQHSSQAGYNPPPFGPIHPQQYPTSPHPTSPHPANPGPANPIPATARPGLFATLGQQLGMSLRPQRLLWLGGGVVALGLFLSNGLGRWGNGLIAKSFHRDLCQEMVQPSVSLSRAQLTELLTVPERSPKATIRAQAPAPYCTLTDLEIRAGATAQREAYPLAFDPDTWLVMLYEGDEYAGYAFRFE